MTTIQRSLSFGRSLQTCDPALVLSYSIHEIDLHCLFEVVLARDVCLPLQVTLQKSLVSLRLYVSEALQSGAVKQDDGNNTTRTYESLHLEHRSALCCHDKWYEPESIAPGPWSLPIKAAFERTFSFVNPHCLHAQAVFMYQDRMVPPPRTPVRRFLSWWS